MGVKFNPFTSKLDIVDSPSGEFSDIELALGTQEAPSLSFTGDPNTGIYSPGADQVAISTAGAGRLFVDASGNVGVGTSSISFYQGSGIAIRRSGTATLRLEDSGLSTSEIKHADGSGLIVETLNSRPIIFSPGATERMRLDSSGRLGLGTTSPGGKAHIAHTSGLPVTSGSTQTHGALRFGASGTNGVLDIGNAGASGSWLQATNQTSLIPGNSFPLLLNPNGGNVGIGTTDPGSYGANLAILGSGNGIISVGQATSYTTLQSNGQDFYINLKGTGSTVFRRGSSDTESARLDGSGRLLVGTSTARSTGYGSTASFQLESTSFPGAAASLTNNQASAAGPSINFLKTRGTSLGAFDLVANNDVLGRIVFSGADGVTSQQGAIITADVDGTPGAGDLPTRLVFSTTADGAASPTERLRISANGSVRINTTGGESAALVVDNNNAATLGLTIYDNANSGWIARFYNNTNVLSGSITRSGSSVAYNTSSDYRLKENVIPLTGAVDRVNQLQVHRFNFIADPETTVDGFIAHEAQAVVPECVTGTKDEVDENGDPVYQGIDQSKLVPLLTAALQEALAEIESLKARVTALEP